MRGTQIVEIGDGGKDKFAFPMQLFLKQIHIFVLDLLPVWPFSVVFLFFFVCDSLYFIFTLFFSFYRTVFF